MDNKELRYVAIVSKTDDGKFRIVFPNFDGISTVVEKEENIEKNAEALLEMKIKELKSENIELPTPTSAFDIQKNLKEGEVTTYVSVRKFSTFSSAEASKNISNFFNKTREEVNGAINNKNIPAADVIEKIGLDKLGMGAAIVYLVSIFLPTLALVSPGEQKIRFGFFSNPFKSLYYFLPLEIDNSMFLLRFAGFVLLFAGAFALYAFFKRNRFFMFASSGICAALFVITFIVMFFKKESFVSFSFGMFLMFLASLVFAVIAFLLWNQNKNELIG